MKFILFRVTLDLSDNLTEMREKAECFLSLQAMNNDGSFLR